MGPEGKAKTVVKIDKMVEEVVLVWKQKEHTAWGLDNCMAVCKELNVC